MQALRGAGLDIDEDSDISVSEQLRSALVDNMLRVIDLFREWDTNGDGTVSKSEFQKAMPRLGLHARKEEIDALYDSWDPDGSGTLEITELQRILKRGSSQPMQFTKPQFDNEKLAANASPQDVRAHLANLAEECERLETAQAERSNARMTIQHLESEIAVMRKQQDKVTRELESEEHTKQDLEAKNKSKTVGMMDPAVMQRNVELLRIRNNALKKMHTKVSDPQRAPKEDTALENARIELAKLRAERQRGALNLKQLIRQLEGAERHAMEHAGEGRPDVTAISEAHLKRLAALERKGREACASRTAAAAALKEDWERWLQLLNQCARTLQARSDSGDANAKVGESASPATSVLEMIRRKEQKRLALAEKAKECDEREKVLQNKLDAVRAKVVTQRTLLEACLNQVPKSGSELANGSPPAVPQAVTAA